MLDWDRINDVFVYHYSILTTDGGLSKVPFFNYQIEKIIIEKSIKNYQMIHFCSRKQSNLFEKKKISELIESLY